MSKPWLAWKDGWWWYATPEEARTAAERALELADQGSRYGDGWPDDTGRIGWGVTLYQAVEVNRKTNTCDECGAEPGEVHDCDLVEEGGTVYDPEHPYTCGYELQPIPGAIEAVLAMATPEQLRAELARREAEGRDFLASLPDIPDWHESLVAAGLVRDEGGWSRPGSRIRVIGTHTSGVIGAEPSWVRWWQADEDFTVADILRAPRYATEEQAARAWLAARGVSRG